MAFSINFNEEKNQLLKAIRGIGFDEVVEVISNGKSLADIAHPNIKRPNQRIYIVRIRNYAYVVPYVINEQKNEIFLKTIYASRVFTKRYIKGDSYE